MSTLEKGIPLIRKHSQRNLARGFSLIELLIVTAVLMVVLGGIVQYIAVASQRSKIESTKVDLSQEAREFVDEFERDIHQAGYPNCRQFNNAALCPNAATYPDKRIAAGLVSVSSTKIIFEGDVDGDGNVDSVQYQLVDSALNPVTAGSTCPCTIRRSQIRKVQGDPQTGQGAPQWSQELNNVVNSGTPTGSTVYGGGLSISGTALFRGGAVTNDAYYAAVSTFKDYPVFSAYDQTGLPVQLPQDISTPGGQTLLQCPPNSVTCIKSIRLTINLLGSGTTGYDTKTFVRPVVTLVGTGRMDN
jgi:prepilin-type N-terminal cleavage/methylation domain-containing protein